MTFEQFQASRTAVADVNPWLIDLGADPNDNPTAGYLYDEGSYMIEKLDDGMYSTFWGNEIFQNIELSECEQFLFEAIQEEDA